MQKGYICFFTQQYLERYGFQPLILTVMIIFGLNIFRGRSVNGQMNRRQMFTHHSIF